MRLFIEVVDKDFVISDLLGLVGLEELEGEASILSLSDFSLPKSSLSLLGSSLAGSFVGLFSVDPSSSMTIIGGESRGNV
jgi:hypothetical protein